MLLMLLLAQAAAAQTPVDAERAFAADAQRIGQWTAFRKWSAKDAVMFAPQPINAETFLKDRKNPPEAIERWPTASYISCDGSVAVNTGGWKRSDGSTGFFSTVWKRQKDGSWRWIVDGNGDLAHARPRPAQPLIRRAACDRQAVAPHYPISRSASFDNGESDDNSLSWSWSIEGRSGDRTFATRLWTARDSGVTDGVILDHIPAPSAAK